MKLLEISKVGMDKKLGMNVICAVQVDRASPTHAVNKDRSLFCCFIYRMLEGMTVEEAYLISWMKK